MLTFTLLALVVCVIGGVLTSEWNWTRLNWEKIGGKKKKNIFLHKTMVTCVLIQRIIILK